MFLSGGSLGAVPLADGGDNSLNGANMTLTHTLSISYTRGSTAPVLTPGSQGGVTINPGGTWSVDASPPNINVSS